MRTARWARTSAASGAASITRSGDYLPGLRWAWFPPDAEGTKGRRPCGWTGEKQAPASQQAPVDSVADSIARVLGYKDGASPAYIADCERAKNHSARLP
jgi:hypothetical protein